MVNHREKAMDIYNEGYNCAQSVFASFSDLTGISLENSVRLASGFGGGIGRLRGTCGAVIGMIMAADMLYGYVNPADPAIKDAHYELVKSLAKKFEDLNGSMICRTLKAENPKAQDCTDITDENYGLRRCARLVGDAAEILDEYIAKRGLK